MTLLLLLLLLLIIDLAWLLSCHGKKHSNNCLPKGSPRTFCMYDVKK